MCRIGDGLGESIMAEAQQLGANHPVTTACEEFGVRSEEIRSVKAAQQSTYRAVPTGTPTELNFQVEYARIRRMTAQVQTPTPRQSLQ